MSPELKKNLLNSIEKMKGVQGSLGKKGLCVARLMKKS